MIDSTAQESRYRRFIVSLINRLWPKFHNRITWVVVGTGLALAASPWWTEIVTIIVADIFQRDISIPDHPWIGITLVAIALLYNLSMTWAQRYYPATGSEDKSTVITEHDRAIFERHNLMMPENDLTETLDYVDKSRGIFRSQLIMLKEVNHYLSLHDGQFIDNKMQAASMTYQTALHELLNFLGKSFFTDDKWASDSEDDDCRFTLFPAISGKRSSQSITPKQRQVFSEAEEELGSRIDDLKEKYNLFRQTAKSTLIM